MIEVGFVSSGRRGEEGGEVGGRERGGGGAVQGGDRVRQDAVDTLGEGALPDDALAVRGEQARHAPTFLGDVAGDLGEEALEGGDVDVAERDEGRRRQGAALGDGGGAVRLIAGMAGEDHEVGGVALGGALLARDQAAGGGGGDGLGGDQVAEAGVAAVPEGVEVALGSAGAGTVAAATRRSDSRGVERRAARDVIGGRGGHRTHPWLLFGCEHMKQMF